MKKVPLSIILFLILVLQSFIPSWATEQEISELKDQIRNLSQRVQPTGSIFPFAGEITPDGWLMCNGQIVSCDKYIDLYKIIGRRYTPQMINQNIPLGEDLFCVPDMRGRVIVGVDSEANRVTSRNTLGSSGGEENYTLTVNHLPITDQRVHDKINRVNDYKEIDIFDTSATASKINKGFVKPCNNMQPYLVLNYIIKY